MTQATDNAIRISDIRSVEPAGHGLRIHMHEPGQRSITLQLSAGNVRKLARLLEPVFDDDNYAAQRVKRLVKLGRLKETYGACLVSDLLARYPEYDLDQLERDLKNFV